MVAAVAQGNRPNSMERPVPYGWGSPSHTVGALRSIWLEHSASTVWNAPFQHYGTLCSNRMERTAPIYLHPEWALLQQPVRPNSADDVESPAQHKTVPLATVVEKDLRLIGAGACVAEDD